MGLVRMLQEPSRQTFLLLVDAYMGIAADGGG